MTESGTGDDVAADLEREADRLEHHLDELGDHISDAQKSADERRADLDPQLDDDGGPAPGDAGD